MWPQSNICHWLYSDFLSTRFDGCISKVVLDIWILLIQRRLHDGGYMVIEPFLHWLLHSLRKPQVIVKIVFYVAGSNGSNNSCQLSHDDYVPGSQRGLPMHYVCIILPTACVAGTIILPLYTERNKAAQKN